MVEDSLTTEGLKSKIGIENAPEVYEIEKGMIRRFVLAVDDPNPLWQDEEYAGKSRYGGIIAPPTFVLTIGFDELRQQLLESIPFGSLLHGSTELEGYQPVRADDTITVTTKITNIRERQDSRMGKTVFVTVDVTYKNQKQELVARCQQMIIGYKIEATRHG
ncbi:MAG: MaoC family dehydratase N-terminal domain-containing protein [Dehalococcoidales bacterium]